MSTRERVGPQHRDSNTHCAQVLSPRHGLRRTSVGASPLGSRQGSYSINQGPLFDAAVASAVAAAAISEAGTSPGGGGAGGPLQQQLLPPLPRRGSMELAIPLQQQSRPNNPFAGQVTSFAVPRSTLGYDRIVLSIIDRDRYAASARV